jgi:hypothetical protein
MSLYKQGAGDSSDDGRLPRNERRFVGASQFVPPSVVITPPPAQAESGFWTLIKWMGAGLTLWVGYEKIQEFWNSRLPKHEEEPETTSEVATED